MPRQTLVVGLAHPDDELAAAGTILAQRARGDRVVIVWLTSGEMTAAFGALPKREVARRREEQGRRAGELLDAETRFLDFEDTRIMASPDTAAKVASVLAELQPDGLLTWGDGWTRGFRHPDHRECGRIFRDAVHLARIANIVEPIPPHRDPVPVFTYRDTHSQLPAAAIDVERYRERIHELARFYRQEIGFGDERWLEHRLTTAGQPWGLRYAEVFDAWESEPGRFDSLLPTRQPSNLHHPNRDRPVGTGGTREDSPTGR